MARHGEPLTTEETVLLRHAEEALTRALETLRQITPEGWDKAYGVALVGPSGWHTGDCAMLRAAREISMRCDSPRFRPPREN